MELDYITRLNEWNNLPPHRRNRNAANNIFISERAERQRRILNITSTAQNETPFALFLSLQFWNEQNTGAKPRLITSYMDESAQPTTKQKNVQQKGNKRLTSRWRYNTIQRADYYNRPNHTGGNNTFQNRTSRNALCLIRTTYKQKGLLFALYRTIRKQAAQHTTNETRRAHTANK